MNTHHQYLEQESEAKFFPSLKVLVHGLLKLVFPLSASFLTMDVRNKLLLYGITSLRQFSWASV